jgi:hypothetical protein
MATLSTGARRLAGAAVPSDGEDGDGEGGGDVSGAVLDPDDPRWKALGDEEEDLGECVCACVRVCVCKLPRCRFETIAHHHHHYLHHHFTPLHV